VLAPVVAGMTAAISAIAVIGVRAKRRRRVLGGGGSTRL